VQKTVLGRLLDGEPRKQETKHSECVSLRNAA
jgi:hypothetical protein